jgi:hypothetical protein
VRISILDLHELLIKECGTPILNLPEREITFLNLFKELHEASSSNKLSILPVKELGPLLYSLPMDLQQHFPWIFYLFFGPKFLVKVLQIQQHLVFYFFFHPHLFPF